MLKPREVEVTFPNGDKKRYRDLKILCDEMDWPYLYVRSRDARKGFMYREHKVIRTGGLKDEE